MPSGYNPCPECGNRKTATAKVCKACHFSRYQQQVRLPGSKMPVRERLVVALACQHHWIIAAPRGATSEGICQKCGEVKAFNNYPWYDTAGELMLDRPGT